MKKTSAILLVLLFAIGLELNVQYVFLEITSVRVDFNAQLLCKAKNMFQNSLDSLVRTHPLMVTEEQEVYLYLYFSI